MLTIKMQNPKNEPLLSSLRYTFNNEWISSVLNKTRNDYISTNLK